MRIHLFFTEAPPILPGFIQDENISVCYNGHLGYTRMPNEVESVSKVYYIHSSKIPETVYRYLTIFLTKHRWL